MRRRLAAILVLTAVLWMPAASIAPVAQAAVPCTSWGSSRIPPTTIRVYRTSGPQSGTVQTVDFRTYVGVVLAAEFSASWPAAILQVGAVVVKEYAWYYVINPRGGSVGGNCYDVADNTNDQIYWPESRSPSAGELAAIDATWYETIGGGGGTVIMTGYRSGNNVGCGTDADGYHLFQASARNCAAGGMSADQILLTYFGAYSVSIWNPPARPATLFESPGAAGTVTAGASATASWTEEVATGSSVASRKVTLQMAAPINGSCAVDRWLPASPPWTSTDPSPQTATGLKSGFCYRFVVALTDSAASTTYTASSTILANSLAPMATFSSPAVGTLTAMTDSSITLVWAETSAPGTSIVSRTLTTEYAVETMPGSCAGSDWQSGSSVSPVSGVSSGWLAHFNCYRWRMTLVDSAGHSGTWLSGVVVQPAT